ncbi:MAG: 50S ribosomal protein L10 [Mycoplasmatales bacterium]
MSVAAIEIKKQQVEEIKTKIENSAATVVFQYSGLTVAEMTELRNKLREENVEIKVLKNNIASKAFAACNFEGLEDEFKGPTAVAFSKDDVTAAARILHTFGKKHKALVLKAGTYDKEVASLEQVKELATLPNKDGMLSMLLSVLEAPIRGLAQVTNQVAEQKENN